MYGPDAFPVATGEVSGQAESLVAASRFGKGRVLALGHSGFFSAGAMDVGDTARLMTNMINWAGGDNRRARRVGVYSVNGLAARTHGPRWSTL